MKRILLLTVFLVPIVTYLIWGFATLERRPDNVQITSLIDFAEEAIRDRNLQALMSCISKNYRDDEGLNYDRARLLAMEVFQIERPYDVKTKVESIRITGTRAAMRIDAQAEFLDDGEIYKRNLVVHLRKEPARHALLIPTRLWKITKVEGLGLESLD